MSTRTIFINIDFDKIIEKDLATLLAEEDEYQGKGNGYTLQHIDGLLLTGYKYSPMGGSSYIPLPADIEYKKAIINSQNTDKY